MRLNFLFCFSNHIHTYNYTRLAEVSIGYALTTNNTKSGFYLYVLFILFTPHGNFNVQTHTHTHTQQKQCKEKTKQKTNKQTPPPPPPKKIFVFCLNLLQDAKIPFRFILFEEKKRGIWLSSMTHSVTQGATPVRWEADKHVTKLNGVTGQLV